MSSVRKDVLPNGLTVITEAIPAVRSVSLGFWIRAGSRNEPADENGITHFLEHMVFKGTEKRSAEEIARAADSIGGHLDAFTAKELTNFSIKVLDEHLTQGFDILADLLKRPLLRADHLAKERQVIQEEIKLAEDTPDDLVHEIFTQSYWRGHALGRPILGTRRTVRDFDRRRLLGYFHRFYRPNNMLVAAAGHVRHSQVVDLVVKEFGDLTPGEPLDNGPVPIPHPHIRYRRKKDLEQVHICIGTPAYSQSHERRFPCYILNTVLGGGMSSRLFQNIREKRGLVYAVFSGLSAFRDTGCLNVYAGTSTERAQQVIRLVLEEFCRLKSGPISSEELRRAKAYLKGSLLLSLESTTNRMANLARQEMFFGRHISQDEVARRVDRVSKHDVLEVARDLLAPEQIAVTVLGPLNGLHLNRADLAC
jgi:predicted Zn-dependent peptidase